MVLRWCAGGGERGSREGGGRGRQHPRGGRQKHAKGGGEGQRHLDVLVVPLLDLGRSILLLIGPPHDRPHRRRGRVGRHRHRALERVARRHRVDSRPLHKGLLALALAAAEPALPARLVLLLLVPLRLLAQLVVRGHHLIRVRVGFRIRGRIRDGGRVRAQLVVRGHHLAEDARDEEEDDLPHEMREGRGGEGRGSDTHPAHEGKNHPKRAQGGVRRGGGGGRGGGRSTCTRARSARALASRSATPVPGTSVHLGMETLHAVTLILR